MVVAVELADLERVVAAALAEDLGDGDVTSEGVVGPGVRCRAQLLLKEGGVVCGLPAAEAVFRLLDPDVRFQATVPDGRFVGGPAVLAEVEGAARALLGGERTALNFLGRLSGVATLAHAFADAVEGTGTVVLDTRKTTPGLRELEKYAVRTGGAENHRFGLGDGILVKDNHLALAGGIAAAVRLLRAAGSGLPIEVEVETLDETREALAAGADRLLLDNMPLAAMAEAVRLARARGVATEASGGITLATIRTVAETGVDFVSVGALTHSARSLDVSLEVLP